MVNLKFPSKLLYRVLESVEEQGFCVLGAEEMEHLFSRFQGGFAARREALEEFAILSGLTMETTPFRDKIGCKDFERVAEFKRWLSSHPKRRSIRAYLLYELPNGSDDF